MTRSHHRGLGLSGRAILPRREAARLLRVVKVEVARDLIAQCKTVEDVKAIRDKAEAIRNYLRQQNASREAQNDAAEIKLRAERRLGDLLVEQKATGERRRHGERARRGSVQPLPPTLRDLGVEKTAAARWQRVCKIPVPKFESYITRTRDRPDGEITTADLLRLYGNEVRYRERIANLARIAKGNTPLRPANRYPVIYADPPWRYEFSRLASQGIENHYPTLEVEEICALPVGDLATPDAVLFLWSPSPKLAEAMAVIEAWGFTQRTSMVWVKDKPGVGYYARQRHELLLIATRGDPPTPPPAARPDSVVEAPRGKHSAKPRVVAALIERMFPRLPRVELFCRGRPRPGWNAWGNEVLGARGRVAGDVSVERNRRERHG